ncbi:VOC family protein [Glaciihabitans sp. dw_435]|uniref:VOC family protein n=1 Tax=Glaciihabitans sp. dw_435 TaxID=2720081 RepID=UPI001BD544DD|nr:VOC family protein [Glaciihabitans sp. dw_435]
MITIALTSIFVEDQQRALDFYTSVVGFEKKLDEPVGEFRWLTVTTAGVTDGVQLLLEPNDNPVSQAFQKGIREQGIPATSFVVDDLEMEFERMTLAGAVFVQPPTDLGGVLGATFDDTVGNLIGLTQV